MQLEKASRLCKAKTVGCDGFHKRSPLGLGKRDKRSNCGVIGEGVEWKMAVTSLQQKYRIDWDAIDG